MTQLRFDRVSVLALAVLLVAVPALTGVGEAKSPRESSWGSIQAVGPPVDAGFVDAGFVAYAAGDSPATPGATGDCPGDTGAVDLFLVTFPDGEGCVASTDASDNREINGLATANEIDRIFVTLAPASTPLSSPNFKAYDVDNGSLSQTFSDTLEGDVLDVATDAKARNVAVTFQRNDASQPDRLVVYTADGERSESFKLPGLARDVSVSDNGRYVAVGGNLTQDGKALGWARLYDLDLAKDRNPVIDRKVREARAGITASVDATNPGRIVAGSLGGDVRFFTVNGSAQPIFVDADAVQVDATPNGRQIFAGAGSMVAGLSTDGGSLTQEWNRTVNGTIDTVQRVGPHNFALAGNVHGFGPGGQRMWETTGGDVLAVNGTGTGLAIAASRSTDTGEDSTLSGRVLEGRLTINQTVTPTISPGSLGFVQANVTNNGSAFLNLTPSAPNASDIRVRSVPASFGVAPDRSRDIAFRVEVGDEVAPGDKEIDIAPNAQPIGIPGTSLTFEVGARSNVSLSLLGDAPTERTVTHGQTERIRLLLENSGNTAADVDLEVVQALSSGPDWTFEVEPSTNVTIPANARTTVNVDLTVPEDAEDGVRNELAIRAITDQGTRAIGIDLIVNPFRVLEIEPRTQTKKLAPGTTIPFNLSVVNKGSVPASVSLRAQAVDPAGDPLAPTNQSGWGIGLDTSRVQIEPGQAAPVQIELSSPANITSEDQKSLRVQLVATADDGTHATGLVNGVADPSLAQDDDAQRRQPFLGLAAIASVVAITAVARRSKA